MSLYDELEVPKSASQEEIRRAHRKKAMKHHPDRGGKPEKFHAIQKAYEVLGDPARRKRYDATGEGDQQPDLRQQALDRLAMMLIGAIDHFQELDAIDLIEEMRKAVLKQKAADRDELSKFAQQIKKRERALKRLRFKGAGADYFRMMIESNIAEKKANIESGERAMELHEEVLKVLSEYEYQAQRGQSFGAMEASLRSLGGGTATSSW